MKLSFFGGAKEVTGSNYLLESEGTKILIDCGLFQGSNYCDDCNHEQFQFNPKEIDALLITHAHIDHIGRVPKLFKDGFRGKIFSTEPSKDFAEPLLLDAEHMMREESARRGTEVIYNIDDIDGVLKLWDGVKYHEKMNIGPFEIEFYDAGHVLGSSSILIKAEGKKILFSGDLGNVPSLLIKDTEYFSDVDYALIESAYGDRIHEDVERRADILEDAIEETVKQNGVVMIPSFALERTQEMIVEISELIKLGKIPDVPVFIDSPLAIKLTAIYQKYGRNPDYFNDKFLARAHSGQATFDLPGITMSQTPEQSKEINGIPAPKVIIAGSGMSQGGRILYHEMRYLPDPRSLILFVGYQSKGSLGRAILDGARKVRIMGEDVDVNCRIGLIGGYSAHADQNQLLKWLEPMREKVKKVFVVQGEEESAEALAQKARDLLAIDAEVPSVNTTVVL
ncbi:MAG: MBL fold metallo-hydrolase [Candidatus Jorgensenbacteria bacterium]|nr:MBL fold metallo-hydrolase [Candidatus Jorgensenbacteria bacterium]